MQNLRKKLRQSSIVFKEPGILSENLWNFDELQLACSSMIFAETSHTLTTYQCLQKGVWDFFFNFD